MWNEYDINIKNETEDYKIKVKRGEDKGITINGEKANNDLIPKGKGSLNIEVII